MRRQQPGAEIVCVADDAGFPYGEWEDAALTDRVVGLIADLVDGHRPDAVVSPATRPRRWCCRRSGRGFDLPFVGTVPAIKPAAERTQSGVVSVLGTYGTIRRDYTRALIDSFAAQCHVRLVGSGNLAPYAERHMRGEPVDDAAILAEIAPAFIEQDGRRTDMVVLACTHYPFLLAAFRAPRAVAGRVDRPGAGDCPAGGRGDGGNGAGRQARPAGEAILTSGRPWTAALAPLLLGLGLEPSGSEAVARRLGRPLPARG